MHILSSLCYNSIRGEIMYREIEEALVNWKKRKNKKPLIIKGARQVGKTYSIRSFASKNYKTVVEINFERNMEYIDLFKRTRNPKEILNYIEISNMDKTLEQNSTLLFFDEIQACGDALTTLKFLAEECPYDIICSGSMLGIAISSSSSFPVGYVETWEMFPMNFVEFLIALGMKKEHISMLQEHLTTLQPLEPTIHEKFNELFTKYMICGGMPEVVMTYVETGSLAAAIKVQRRIVQDYHNDMAKYANHSDKIKVMECYSSLPLQLAKENKKFQYKFVKEGYNARYYEASLKWLEESGLVIKVNRLKCIKSPLEAYVELPIFKIYMSDTGLLLSQFDDQALKDILTNKMDVYKGALYENIGAQILHSMNKKCYYYEPNTSSEIDFIIYYEGNVTPIEVKSSIRTRSTSFNKFVEDYNSKKAFRFSTKNISVKENIYYLPYYLLPFLLQSETTTIL